MTKQEKEFFEDITDAYVKDNLIPVIGSGISMPFGFPNWAGLVKEIAKKYKLGGEALARIEELLSRADYLGAVDQLIEAAKLTEHTLQEEVAQIFSQAKERLDLTRDSNYRDLEKMKMSRFLTTNYDELINDISGAHFVELEELAKGKIESNGLRRNEYRKAVFPIHGRISQPEKIVFSRESYRKLYETNAFEESFLFLRASYTFLFMGFSFDDCYIHKLFQKVIGKGNFRQSHYILFDNSRKGSPEVEQLERDYGVKPIFYDTTAGHVEPIRAILSRIVRFFDETIDVDSMERLPGREGEVNPAEVEEDLRNLEEAVAKEKLSVVSKLCGKLMARPDYKELPVLTRQTVGCYRIWYYSYLQQYEASERVMEEMDAEPELYSHRERCAAMYLQLLWNSRNWRRAEEFLASLKEKGTFISLMEDIIKVSREILPSAEEKRGEIKVYGEEPWDKELCDERHRAYLKLKEKYVNPHTYNLLRLKEYKNADNQEIAYYWLGIVAGQVFHEHREAVQYLYRANELSTACRYYESLARNYLAIGEEKVRFQTEGKYYDLDIEALLNARRCFQYAMQTEDMEFKRNLYQKSGAAYLQVLFYLKKYYEYEEFYKEAAENLPHDYGLRLQKAMVDVQYLGVVSEEELSQLKKEDRFYIELVREISRVQFYQREQDQEKAQEIYKNILSRIEKEYIPGTDARIIPILQDCLFFTGQLSEKTVGLLGQSEEMAGFYEEAQGNLEKAEEAFRQKFDSYKDISTFTVLNGFYLRTGQKEKSDRLYEEVLDRGRIAGDRLDIIQGYILNYMNVWRQPGEAVRIFLKYEEELDTKIKQELEEMLKPLIGDYSDCDSRVRWNRQMLSWSPEQVRRQFYENIFYLYISNLRFQEAGALLEEMRQYHCQGQEEMERLQAVMMRPQKGGFYTRRPVNFNLRQLERLRENAKKGGIYGQYCFGLEGKKAMLPIFLVIFLYFENRQAEFSGFSEVFISYAGIIKLEQGLYSSENALFRMVLQGLSSMGNLRLVAPGMKKYIEVLQQNKSCKDMEKIQNKAYLKEHPDIVVPIYL